ncbi:putative helicase mov-10-B.1, partial [Sitodiplosis mosellana]|uniref:putative helicase mov-10-B.1 n=1 Tax=Sitodiplosis mosellana TaxID=263140 RepID=UPI002444EA27
TGKTKTLVAAILEIMETTTSHVLVCANSNAASDEITHRLLNELSPSLLFRMYAKSYKIDQVTDAIRPVCNLVGDGFQFPPLEQIYKYRIVICTLLTSGCLTRSRGTTGFFSGHFDYVFIDEAASSTETTTLIPIAGLCTENKSVGAKIILSGDIKKLDAVVQSKHASRYGLKTSYMERLSKLPAYKSNSFGKYNPSFIVQLTKNYRSHHTILHIPNKLFYEGALESKACPESTELMLGSDFLPNQQFPIIFHTVAGTCEQFKDVSYCNRDEVSIVMNYIVEKLIPLGITDKDIGVISPYKKQCQIIRALLKLKNHDGISVGTAEIYQGQEKPIIIVSTVRSDTENELKSQKKKKKDKLGFLRDERRLNVILTRAISLLIIVGNHETLQEDENWKAFIDYVHSNEGLINSSGKALHPRIEFPN